MKIENIKPYSKNSKKHTAKQISQVANSIKRFGFIQPIVIDKNNEVVIGHCRLEAAQLLKLKDVPTVSVEKLSDKEVKALRLADNKLNESAWEMDIVIEELKGLDLDLLDLTGFDRDLIIESDPRDDEIPENAPRRCNKGELWKLGKHRILCGNSTNEKDVKKLLGGGVAKLVFTSPPYNMAGGMYENYEDNLKSEEYIKFNLEVINLFKKYLKGFIFWNISYNKKTRHEFIEIIYKIIKETGFKFLELIVWNKKHAMPITSKEMLTRQYEDILLVGDEDSIKQDLELYFCGRNEKGAYFNKITQRGITNYWEIGTNNTQLQSHLACFPLAFPVKGIITMTSEKDIVVDPFLGSGSTLIACEKTKRICYGMELSELYCDVIIKRYEDYTGKKATRIE